MFGVDNLTGRRYITGMSERNALRKVIPDHPVLCAPHGNARHISRISAETFDEWPPMPPDHGYGREDYIDEAYCALCGLRTDFGPCPQGCPSEFV